MGHIRFCGVCGTRLTPFSLRTYTAHEFECYKRKPELIPEHFREEHASLLIWERRSKIAKQATQKRKAQRVGR